MNTLVVYFSKFGNTQKVAEAIADVLESAGSVCLLSLDELTVSDLQHADLIVMGSPTHRMNLPEAVLACELLGLDPIYVANEGVFIAIVPAKDASTAYSPPKTGCHPQERST